MIKLFYFCSVYAEQLHARVLLEDIKVEVKNEAINQTTTTKRTTTNKNNPRKVHLLTSKYHKDIYQLGFDSVVCT